jgi:tetraacyldisaccharide 4'-kinase
LDPFGGGRLLPAGYLREPLSSVNRANAIIITRSNLISPQEIEKVKKDISAIIRSSVPVFLCDIAPTALIGPDTSELSLNHLGGKKTALLSAIGSPAQFEKTVRSLGAVVIGHHFFRDHHPFSISEIQHMAENTDKEAIFLTTQKDFVRIPAAQRYLFHQLKIEARVREADEFAKYIKS